MIKPGDIGYVMHHDNIISKLIARAMGSRWSHAFLVLEVTKERIYIAETSDFQVTIGTLDRYLENPNDEVEIWSSKELMDEQRISLAKESLNLYGQIYGYLQLFSLGIRRLFMKFGIKIPNFIRVGLVCCHVVTYSYSKQSNIAPFSGMDAESIDTEELYQMMVDSKKFKLITYKPKSNE